MASETHSRARLAVPLSVCLAAVAALSLGVRSANFVDAALPLYAAAVATVAWLEGRRFGDAALAFAIPLLAVWRIAVIDENLRIFLYGITLTGALAVFVARATAGSGRLRTGDAVVLLAACLAATRLVPSSAELAPAQAIVIIGTMILAASLAGRDGVGAGTFLVCLAAGLVTPLAPLKATLFPLLLASVLAVLRGPSPFSVAALVASAALAGRWAWPMAALTLASGLLSEMVEPVIDRRRAQAKNAVAAAPLAALPAASGALSALLWSPESVLRVFKLARPARIAALALVAAALVLRPALGTLYLIAALAILLADELLTVGGDRGGVSARSGIPLVAAVFTVAMLSLAGFSGAVVSRFPLPLQFAELAAVAVVALAATVAGRFASIGSAVSAVALVVVVAIAGAPAIVEPIEARAVLSAGETWELELPPGGGVRVELSGGNLTALEPGTPVGTLEAIDRAGRVVRREVEIGDLADWGMGRPEHYFATRNEWPSSTQAVVAEYGHEAFLEGSGTVAIGIPNMVRLRITASPTLPERGRLNLESVKGVRW